MPQLEPIVVQCGAIHWPRFYTPSIIAGVNKERYGCAFDASLISMELRPYATVKSPSWQAVEQQPELSGVDMVILSSQWRPRVLTEDNRHGTGQLVQLLQFMDASNMPRDWLFKGIRANLLLQPVEWRSEDRPRRHDQLGRALNLMAVQVRYTDLLAAYDRLCAEYFADPTYPRRETDGQNS